jgi:hypothetical protein
MIADQETDTAGLSHSERATKGLNISLDHEALANWHMHQVLYGLLLHLLERAFGKPLDALVPVRINVTGAPDPDMVRLPLFVLSPTGR